MANCSEHATVQRALRYQVDESNVSLRSDCSKDVPYDFKHDPHDQRKIENAGPELGSVSLGSDHSKDVHYDFKKDPHDHSSIHVENTPYDQDIQGEVEAVFKIFEGLVEDIHTFMKEELQRFCTVLTTDNPEWSETEEKEQKSKEAALNIVLDFLRRRKQEKLAESLLNRLNMQSSSHKLKQRLLQKFSCGLEDVSKGGRPTLLNQIYTELCISEGGASEVNQEHEVRLIENASRTTFMPETTIQCEDIFKGPTLRQGPIREGYIEKPIRAVLMKGVAGIGKTMLTKKFSLDWAEGRANQDIQLLFPFTFRELNVLRDTEYSLVGLLHHFFGETERLNNFEHLEVLFIFDGLDECRFPLDFSKTRVLTDPTENALVEVLLINLIRGSLLPSARLCITTRPAAANQIPAEFVSMVTEVRGFTDQQKEQYFRNWFKDECRATVVISHIKSIRSLYIMSHIPLFSWILSTVLEHVLIMREREELPHTLTQMYIHFVVVQVKAKSVKYDGCSGTDQHWTSENIEMVQSLGKLAFEQLKKGNLLFYGSELRECELDAAVIARYSGVFTQIFREEPGLYQDRIYCFVHLTVQEFLAALHVHHTFFKYQVNLLSSQHSAETPGSEASLYRSAVDQALQSPNGHLDLFLRFLLGLSLSTNQRLLPAVLCERSLHPSKETVEYIKEKLNEGLSAEKCLNLFHCLNELNASSLVKDIQWYRKCTTPISPADWCGLAFHLLSSDSELEEFDLRKICPSESALLGLLPVIKTSTKSILSSCNLSHRSCGPLASVLSSTTLTHLDLSNNDLLDSGIESLCSGLKGTSCRLETLRLAGCLISEKGGACLASILRSTHCPVRELDISYNNPGSSEELLIALRDNPHSFLEVLRCSPAGEQYMVPGLRKYFCKPVLDPNTANRKLEVLNLWEVKHVECEELYSDHMDRFDSCPQILCCTALTDSCYWEVEWSGPLVYIAVSYKVISRKEDQGQCLFGDNEWSWNMRIRHGRCSFRHSGIKSGAEFLCSHCLPKSSNHFGGFSGRVGVFLDFAAGSLSFYEVLSDGNIFHLHTFNSSFTDPLFPGFGLWSQASVSLVNRSTSL